MKLEKVNKENQQEIEMMSRLDEVHVRCGACWVVFLKPDRLVAVDCFSSPLLWCFKFSLHLLLLLPSSWLVVRSSCTALKAGGRGATAGAGRAAAPPPLRTRRSSAG